MLFDAKTKSYTVIGVASRGAGIKQNFDFTSSYTRIDENVTFSWMMNTIKKIDDDYIVRTLNYFGKILG